jgi:hypothetical protein
MTDIPLFPRHPVPCSSRLASLLATMLLVSNCASEAAAQVRLPDAYRSATAPRERLSFDAGWRFHEGDPADAGNALAYEVRNGVAWTEGQPEEWTPRGPGAIVATDNGDQTDMEPFQAGERRAFNGLVLAIVRAQPGRAGRITVHAEAEGLAADTVDIDVDQ